MARTVADAALERFTRPALLQEAAGERVRCLTCERRCEIAPQAKGWCQTRVNSDGRLATLIYGAVSSLSANPIEKKPLYHFHPGSLALTAGSFSCNFACPWCQNFDISKVRPDSGRAQYIPAEVFVHKAVERRCQGTSISFNEPTLSLEWSLEVFRLARARGLYNSLVSNGYMTPEALELFVDAGLDAANIDVKGDAAAVAQHCAADVEKVWRNCRLLHVAGVWLEITTLVIPGVTDSETVLRSIATRVAHELGSEVPWHVSAYYPAYKFTAPPTPIGVLERARRIGREAGLRFVYVGNVPGHRWENTACPSCGTLLVEREGLQVVGLFLRQGRCPRCGRAIRGVWW